MCGNIGVLFDTSTLEPSSVDMIVQPERSAVLPLALSMYLYV